ncbi:MAG: hypothetical protein AAB276_04305 [Pseudomonadota bacterium]
MNGFSNLVNNLLNGLTSTVMSAVGGVIGGVASAISSAITGLFASIFGSGFSCGAPGGAIGSTVGDAICNFVASVDTLPGLITALSYLMGLILAISALLKLKDHVLDPHRTPLSDPMKRLLAGAALFSLPVITEALQSLWGGGDTTLLSVTAYAGQVSGGGGLDTMMVALFRDIYGPMMGLLYSFAYFAGLVLTVFGILRIIKTAQDGPRGPAGFGTIMMFAVAGALFSSVTLMEAFSVSIFNSPDIATFAVLQTSSNDLIVDNHILAVISTVLVFMTIVGWISFLRGFFILRDVAEGHGQASLMVSLTHIFGGALAVNLGPLMNMVQSTFGLTSFGVVFT